jgi:8-oxo-dGTP pyrophosphatase MutT (NUDIX family)
MLDARSLLLQLPESARDGEAEKSLELIRMMLSHSAAPFSRSQFAPGHITATGLVIHPASPAVLLVHHRRLNRWLLPGGHVDDEDQSIFAAAAREVTEETSVRLSDCAAFLINFDVHGIPGNLKEPYHLHHDIVVAFRAASADIVTSEESHAVAWCGWDEQDRYQLPANVRRGFRLALETS